MSSGIQYQPLSTGLYTIPKAQILFRPENTDEFELLGDSDEVTINVTVEELERFTNEAGVKTLATTIVTEVDAELNMTLVQLSDRNRALSLLADLTYATQGAVISKVKSLVTPSHDEKIFKLDGDFNVTNVVVTDGTTIVPYVLDTDYKLDDSAGFIQLLSIPVGGDGDVEITYDTPEVLVSDEVAKLGIASNTDNRGEIVIRGTNDVGVRQMITLHSVQIRPDDSRSYVSEEDLDTMSLLGRVFRDDTQDSGFELGFEQVLDATS